MTWRAQQSLAMFVVGSSFGEGQLVAPVATEADDKAQKDAHPLFPFEHGEIKCRELLNMYVLPKQKQGVVVRFHDFTPGSGPHMFCL